MPEVDLSSGVALGPAGFGPTRGPFVFKSDTVFPNLVESLMKNPTGLIYRFSNFDIEDELQRNFAFTSQDIADRTASLVIDNGAYDADGDGVGDLSEINRVAVGSGRITDTNENGIVDENDKRIVFDAEGNQVGISLREALQSLGLKRYIEPLGDGSNRELEKANEFPSLSAGLSMDALRKSIVASTDLTAEETANSYSVTFTDDGLERIYRIRETVSRDPRLGETIGTDVAKTWEVLTSTGINPSISTSDFALSTDNGITLAYVQDLDQDRLPDMVEALNRSSDRFVDSDNRSLLFSLQSPNLDALAAWRAELGNLTMPEDLKNALDERNLNLDTLSVTDLSTQEAKELRTELAARLPAWTLSTRSQDVGAPIALSALTASAPDDVTAMVSDLDNRALSTLIRGEFAEANATLSRDAAITVVTQGNEWIIQDGTNDPLSIRLEGGQLRVFKANEPTAVFSLIPTDVNKLDAGMIPPSVVASLTGAQQKLSTNATVQTVASR